MIWIRLAFPIKDVSFITRVALYLKRNCFNLGQPGTARHLKDYARFSGDDVVESCAGTGKLYRWIN